MVKNASGGRNLKFVEPTRVPWVRLVYEVYWSLCNRIGEHFAIMWDCASTEQKFARDWIWKAVFEQAPYLGAVAFVGAGTMGLIPMGL